MATLFKTNKLKEIVSNISSEDLNDKLEIVKKWHDDYHNGTLKKDKETSREQAFNQEFFIQVLGYKEKPAKEYSLEPKATTEKGQLPDVILGYFNPEKELKNLTAVVELKAANISLDKPQQREGNLSPIQQAFKYKSQYRTCPFVIVSNFWEIRLFQDNQLDYEVWTLDDLVDPNNDYFQFKKFYYLLKQENFTSKEGYTKTQNLLSEIRIEQEEISKKFYSEYKQLRLELLRDLYKQNQIIRDDIELGIQKAQKVIDRIVFICFCEDRGLLPDNTLHKVLNISKNTFGSFRNTLQGLFEAINTGSEELEIPDGYDGGLFEEDSALRDLKISDDILKKLAGLGKYNFEEDLSVTILGHIFEQSITDLEEIKEKAIKENKLPNLKTGKRKEEGIYYTPDYIVNYIVDKSLGELLLDKENELKKKYKLKEDIQDVNYQKRSKQVYQEYQAFLQNIKILDPACGSGAFLVRVVDVLIEENKRVDYILGGNLLSIGDYVKAVLTNNIYGVDKNSESVEITKLSLWLKTAKKGRQLTYLDNNIKTGNSIVESEEIVGSNAFIWNKEFESIMQAGGFNVVVMNPPYIDSESMSNKIPEQREYISEHFLTTKGNWDIYIAFIELATKLTNNNGYISFITPDKWLAKDFGKELRKFILPNIKEIVRAGREVFSDAKVDSIVTSLTKKKTNKLLAKLFDENTVRQVNEIEKSKLDEPYTLDRIFSEHLTILAKVDYFSNKLSSLAECENACATSDAYKLQPFIKEKRYPDIDFMKIINTGTVDKYISRWGQKMMTYLGNKYLNPVINKLEFEKEFGNSYYKKSIRPKIIIKGLTLLDGCIDLKANYVPGKSTLVICDEDLENLKFILAFINSKLPIFYIKNRYSAASYNGGINFTKEMINDFPIPKISNEIKKEFICFSDKLIALKEAQISSNEKFTSLIRTEIEIDKLPKKFTNWWVLDFNNFIKIFKQKYDLNKKQSILKLFDAYQPKLIQIDDQITKIQKQIDVKLYSLYNFSTDEIAVIENSS